MPTKKISKPKSKPTKKKVSKKGNMTQIVNVYTGRKRSSKGKPVTKGMSDILLSALIGRTHSLGSEEKTFAPQPPILTSFDKNVSHDDEFKKIGESMKGKLDRAKTLLGGEPVVQPKATLDEKIISAKRALKKGKNQEHKKTLEEYNLL